MNTLKNIAFALGTVVVAASLGACNKNEAPASDTATPAASSPATTPMTSSSSSSSGGADATGASSSSGGA